MWVRTGAVQRTCASKKSVGISSIAMIMWPMLTGTCLIEDLVEPDKDIWHGVRGTGRARDGLEREQAKL